MQHSNLGREQLEALFEQHFRSRILPELAEYVRVIAKRHRIGGINVKRTPVEIARLDALAAAVLEQHSVVDERAQVITRDRKTLAVVLLRVVQSPQPHQAGRQPTHDALIGRLQGVRFLSSLELLQQHRVRPRRGLVKRDCLISALPGEILLLPTGENSGSLYA